MSSLVLLIFLFAVTRPTNKMKLLRLFALTIAALVSSPLVRPITGQCAANPPATPTNSSSELVVGVVIYDKTEVLDVVGPTSYLELLPIVQQPVRIVTVSSRVGHIQPPGLVPLYSFSAYADAPTKFDVLVIPGGPGDSDVAADKPFVDYVKCAAEQSTFVLSVCTGANILASTGLIDGRNATTNKQKFKEISGKHPHVNWVRKARWVVDGKYWTSSGISAGLDMGHAFIVDQYGQKTADMFAQILEIVPITDSTNDPFEYVVDSA